MQLRAKLSEFAIGQWGFETEERYSMLDSLTYMYQESLILLSTLPIPIVTYDSIVYPFDKQVWGFTIVCIIGQFLLLQAMQYVYCKVSATPNHIEYLYEGAYYDFIIGTLV